jgi:hypothetical protein
VQKAPRKHPADENGKHGKQMKYHLKSMLKVFEIMRVGDNDPNADE